MRLEWQLTKDFKEIIHKTIVTFDQRSPRNKTRVTVDKRSPRNYTLLLLIY